MIAKFIIVGWTLLIGYVFIAGLQDNSEAAPGGSGFTIGLIFGSFILLPVWAIVAVPTYLIARLFKRKTHVA